MESGLTPARHSRASRILILAAALSVLVGLLAAAPPSTAHAEAGSVTINAIGSTKFTAYKAKYRLAPSYSATGDVVVDSATVTVKKGTKTVANNVAAANLAPGKYTVTQTVSYRPFTTETRQQLVADSGTWISRSGTLRPNTCTITDWVSTSESSGTWKATCTVDRDSGTPPLGTVGTEGAWSDAGTNIFLESEESFTLAAEESFAVGSRFSPINRFKTTTPLYETLSDKLYGPSATIAKTQKLTVKAGRKNCATRTDYKKLKVSKRLWHGSSIKATAKRLFSKGSLYYSGVASGFPVEVRVYAACTPGYVVAVGFIDGHAYTKAYGLG
jgi:hypothetical protein